MRFDLPPGRASALTRTLALALLLVPGLGCGSAEQGLVPVRGRVTLDGGPWPKSGVLTFTPSDGGAGGKMRPGSAPFEADGSFKASSFEPGDGLYPGKYGVSVQCWEVEPEMDKQGRMTGKSAVPARYNNAATSGFSVEVPASGKLNDVTFNADSKAK